MYRILSMIVSTNILKRPDLRESSFIRSSPHRAKPALSPSFVRINSAEGTAKKPFLILFLGVLCPVEYPFDRKDIGFAVKLFHGASHLLSNSLNPNSTENFKYV